MIRRAQVETGRRLMAEALVAAGIAVSQEEFVNMEVTDFGLGNYPAEGAQIVTLVNTRSVGFKLIFLLPGQILPEHRHTASMGAEGKEESFRCVYGRLDL